MKRKNDAEGHAGALPASPERTALGLALERAKAAKAARDGALSAEGPAAAAVTAARERVADAEAAIAAAKAEAGQRAAESFAAGDTMEAPVALRQARARLVEAEDDLAVAIAARDSLDARRSTDRVAVAFGDAKVEAAVAAVIKAEVSPSPEALAAEVVGLQKQLADKISALNWLIQHAGALERVEEQGSYFGQPADEDVRVALMRTGTGNVPLPGQRWEDLIAASPAAAALKAAAEALERDATAPVPAIGG